MPPLPSSTIVRRHSLGVLSVTRALVTLGNHPGPTFTDFVRYCELHEWASLDCTFVSELPDCPHCAAVMDDAGHQRFGNYARLLPKEALPDDDSSNPQ